MKTAGGGAEQPGRWCVMTTRPGVNERIGMAHSAPFTQSDHRTTTRFSRGAEEIEYRFKEHCQIHSLPPISTEEKKEKTRLSQQRRNKENRAIRALAGKLVNDHEKIKFLQENTNNQIFEKIKIKSAPDQSKTFPPPPIKKRRDQKEPQEKEKPTEQGQRKIKEFLNKETNEQKQRFSSPKYPQETGPERTLGSETAPLQTRSDSQIQESHEIQEIQNPQTQTLPRDPQKTVKNFTQKQKIYQKLKAEKSILNTIVDAQGRQNCSPSKKKAQS